MRIIAPDYYPRFRCIADKCRHSCCIGWEIDIDPDTRDMYRRIPGEFGARLNASIVDGEVSSFRLGAGERCPMLNASGLCDLITALGEDALCQICADHPRFRNYFADRTEIGLGLCCEEAARLILSQEEPVQLITLEDDGEEPDPPEYPDQPLLESTVHGLRDILTSRMQARELPLLNRIEWILNGMNADLLEQDLSAWVTLYKGLERLDPAWDTVLDGLDSIALPSTALDTAFEQFCVYMLYRHLPGVLEDDNYPGRVKLAAYSTVMLYYLCGAHTKKHGSCSLEDCIEYARMYSAEIEYSQDNIAALLEAFGEES